MSKKDSGVEPQYAELYETERLFGRSTLGIMANQSWNEDPRRHLFTLARYKFVSKMLAGRRRVLEVGCADAYGTRIVQQTVGSVTAVDMNEAFITDIKERESSHWPLTAFTHDMLHGPLLHEGRKFDAAFCLDVLEHIQKDQENKFVANICESVAEYAVVIFGMPSLESQSWASEQSIQGHVNCQNGDELRQTLEQHFHTVFVFSMNDEVVHTGFYPMAHYLLAVCCAPKRA